MGLCDASEYQGKKVSYPEYNLSALINIVYVEKKDVVLATIIDITEQESQARKYYEKKLNTVELAHEVIRKQMTVAQEIAGLLGETAAETKITLLDLCDSLLEEGEKSRGREVEREGAGLLLRNRVPKLKAGDRRWKLKSIWHIRA